LSADENTYLRCSKGFTDFSVSGANASSPSRFVVVENARYGVDNALKTVLKKGGIKWDYGQSGHDFTYLVRLIESNNLAPKVDCEYLLTSSNAVCLSGSNPQSFRYPQEDPLFFENLAKTDLQSRTGKAQNVYDKCYSLVTTTTST
jgi:hypothetical protein